MRSFIASVAASCVATYAQAQYIVDWSVADADLYKVGAVVARDTADNVIVSGYRDSFIGNAHIFTKKFSPSGSLLWEAVDQAGSQWKFQMPTWLNVNEAGDIYVTGFKYSGTQTITPDTLVVLKYDPFGALQWKKEIPRGFTFGVRSALDANGYLYVGALGSVPSGLSLIKVDPNGNTVFDVHDPTTPAVRLNAMRLKNGAVYLSASAGVGFLTTPVVAWDTAGNYLWNSQLRGRGAIDLEVDDAGNSYVLTSYPDQVSASSSEDLVIKKLDSAGDSIAQFSFDLGSGYEASTRLALVNGRLTVIGSSIPQGGGYANWLTLQYDTSGSLLWSATYDATPTNDERPQWLAARANGDVFVTGRGGPLVQGQYLQYVTLKYNAGQQQWAHVDPYYGSLGVGCVLGLDSALYVLGHYAMTTTRYQDDGSVGALEPASVGQTSLRVYPNPVRDLALLELPGPLLWSSLELVGMQGAVVRRFQVPGTSLASGCMVLDMHDLAPGLYALQARSRTGCLRARVVKE